MVNENKRVPTGAITPGRHRVASSSGTWRIRQLIGRTLRHGRLALWMH
jgi:hypothetical protein